MLEHRGHDYKIEASGGVFQGTVWPPGTDRGRAPGLLVVRSAKTAAEAEKLVKEWIDRHDDTK